MREKHRLVPLISVLAFILMLAVNLNAATGKVLYTFTGGIDGGAPYAPVVFGPDGNLYGVTLGGGTYNQGVIFQLSNSQGIWTETVLYSFTGGDDGGVPFGGLALDSAGNIYGTTTGTYPDCGSLFELSPGESGWTFAVLHHFVGGADDGCAPAANLEYYAPTGWVDSTTLGGGPADQGTIFGIKVSGGKPYLNAFRGKNGMRPWGNCNDWFYGTTVYGGNFGLGNIYQIFGNNIIKPKHTFTKSGKAGYYPYGDLLTQVVGRVETTYGTTSDGGGVGKAGAVYQLTSTPPKFKVLHTFSLSTDGGFPYAGLTMDTAGNLYGTTSGGGPNWGYGVVFKLAPPVPGQKKPKWTYSVLYTFYSGLDGEEPDSGVVMDAQGNFYGTTVKGGAYGQGVVYQIIP